MLEQEIKLAFDSIEAARRAVNTAGGRLVVSRRLLVDTLFESPDGRMPANGSTLRLRRDGPQGILTFKGPTLSGPVKIREEIETAVGDADTAERLLTSLGYRPTFRGEKYREEYSIERVHVTIDEAPVGVFVEIEGDPVSIERTSGRLGRTPADYRLESYQRLHAEWCTSRGLARRDMTF